VTKLDGAGLASVFATNSNFQFRSHPSAVFDSDADKSSNSVTVEDLKRIVGKDTTFEI
jgi:hypothetical protein